MPDPSPADSPTPEVASRLHAIARLLRQADHLEPDTQQALAELVDELGNQLDSATGPSPEVAQLTDRTADLAEALHQPEHPGVLASARDQLEHAIVRAETDAPVAAGLARRLVETLSNIGI